MSPVGGSACPDLLQARLTLTGHRSRVLGPGLAAGLPGTTGLRLSGRHSPGQWGQQGSASGDRSVGRGMAAVLMS